MVNKNKIRNEQDIPTIETPFTRIKSVWLFNKTKIREIPYTKDLFQESLIIYLIPILLMGAGVFLSILPAQGINPVSFILIPIQFMIDELISLFSFLLVLYVCMKLILPGFPNNSHANLEMVFTSFSYVYLIRIIGIFGFLLFQFLQFLDGTLLVLFYNLYLIVITVYMIYFVVVSAFATRSLTGKSLAVSLIVGFALFFSIIAFRFLLAVF
ncbi:MAG: hypothetical protein ACW981_09880 [Candidatus Hodarchaeales archaeon]|jgi:hypothetical protein